MFEIKGLSVSVGKKDVIKGISLMIKKGQVHLIMGPNGAGKSTLALALMGHPDFLSKGSIRLDQEELIRTSADERAKKGMFLAFQDPQEVEGVKVGNLIRKALSSRTGGKQDLDEMVRIHDELVKNAKKVGLDESFVSRDLNVGFSGGEKKRLEMLQMMALKPKVAILDELDSGLDVDGIRLVAKAVSELKDKNRCFLIITHYPRILRYIEPDAVHILIRGKIAVSGGPKLAHDIEEHGYSDYLKGKHA